MLRLLLLASVVAAAASVSGSAGASEAHHVRWTGKVATGRTLVVDEPDGTHPLLALPAWATVDDLVVSPSREHALVYVQVHAGETRTVFVLDLVKRAIEATYKPGVGGTFSFTANDNVLQYWGCGTQCEEVQLRTRTGSRLVHAACMGLDDTQELSADRRFLVCFGDTFALDVLDLDRGKTLFRVASTPCTTGHREDVKIDSKNGKVSFTCDADADERYAVTVAFGASPHVTSRRIH
ncbi:MAG: hypothetical protein ABI551_09790 [Polyangiaceae bacterium]